MHSDLVEIGWTEDHLNRISAAISEEAQKARVGAQMLSVVGPLDPTTVAVPSYALTAVNNPRQPAWAAERLVVDSDPTLHLTKIAVNVYLRSREAGDQELNAALAMFRRAANYVARIEDALVFNGRAANLPPAFGLGGIPPVHRITGHGVLDGLFPIAGPAALNGRSSFSVAAAPPAPLGDQVITLIIRSINALDAAGQLGPYACALSPALFEAICTPNASLVLPRDRILPFLQGPLLRSSAIRDGQGVVIALSASPVELVVASDIHLNFLQTTEEAQLAFQVSERVALRIKEHAAISTLVP